MPQTAFGPSCINRASVFEWHKRFKEGRVSVRDDVRCGRSKEVRTPELIGQIKNFIDNDRRVSIETISAQFYVSLGTVHTIIREEPKMHKMCDTFVPKGAQRRFLKIRCYDSREMVELINSDPAVLMFWWPEMKAGSSATTQRPRDRVPSGSMLALPDPRRRDRANPPTNFWSLFWRYWHDRHALGSHWTDSQQGILCWGFKGVQEGIPTEDASTLHSIYIYITVFYASEEGHFIDLKWIYNGTTNVTFFGLIL